MSYYEYAIKQRILENMVWNGENVSQQLQLVESRLRGARNNALGFVNTPNFSEMRKMWEVNRRAQYHNYYNMFLSYAPIQPRVVSGPRTPTASAAATAAACATTTTSSVK